MEKTIQTSRMVDEYLDNFRQELATSMGLPANFLFAVEFEVRCPHCKEILTVKNVKEHGDMCEFVL